MTFLIPATSMDMIKHCLHLIRINYFYFSTRRGKCLKTCYTEAENHSFCGQYSWDYCFFFSCDIFVCGDVHTHLHIYTHTEGSGRKVYCSCNHIYLWLFDPWYIVCVPYLIFLCNPNSFMKWLLCIKEGETVSEHLRHLVDHAASKGQS